MDVKGVKVGLVGIYVLADGMERETQLKENIAEVRAQGAQLVIVSFHWEFPERKIIIPDETQVSFALSQLIQGGSGSWTSSAYIAGI